MGDSVPQRAWLKIMLGRPELLRCVAAGPFAQRRGWGCCSAQWLELLLHACCSLPEPNTRTARLRAHTRALWKTNVNDVSEVSAVTLILSTSSTTELAKDEERLRWPPLPKDAITAMPQPRGKVMDAQRWSSLGWSARSPHNRDQIEGLPGLEGTTTTS